MPKKKTTSRRPATRAKAKTRTSKTTKSAAARRSERSAKASTRKTPKRATRKGAKAAPKRAKASTPIKSGNTAAGKAAKRATPKQSRRAAPKRVKAAAAEPLPENYQQTSGRSEPDRDGFAPRTFRQRRGSRHKKGHGLNASPDRDGRARFGTSQGEFNARGAPAPSSAVQSQVTQNRDH
jgi:hypothetical protein